MRIKIICGLLILCSVFVSVGCTAKEAETTTPTMKTPIQTLNESTSQRFESVWTQLNSKALTSDITSLSDRVGDLEGLLLPDLTLYAAKDTELEGRIGSLEGLNMSVKLSGYDAQIANILMMIVALEADGVTNTSTPTPTPIGATPTPAPTGNHNPTSNLAGVSLGLGNFVYTCTANDIDGDSLAYIWSATNGSLQVMSNPNSVLWLGVNGTQSIVCFVHDSRSGFSVSIAQETYP